ncbi:MULTISPECIES: SDR family NAD(P)-dependent oxidoreductase [Sphingomonadaceae]|jgi:NAD(P)-dependent dehydrogenase (short-subunit alcohol dehydrogenase family)|uniref:Short-chain dehydrogenase/reductase SDR n=1 Tax=Novosphingobium resinovorum TaxID=158500 RepID=A0A031K3Z0_9SPHN|nr:MULTISPECIES: SDR family NAD(P)-dependent oxidoreductase [Sphingomonadaceae]EJU12994.1 short-chain dehydrogenase/reductase SDR [Sphingomonas sp. LH128]EZP84686.1 Short-chain dehydrogenase/reductase SDR [Novosphingobium resinovorum]GLK42483.1 3-ketoacyl-ACP reductase [Novosphingobium resinovorum]
MARSVIVTGGFGVLGQAVAQAFAAAGDKVARVDFAKTAHEPLDGALDIGGVDLTDAASTQAALDTVAAAHGGVDVLVNVAGGFTWETLEDGSIDAWVKMQAMNVLTGATITKLALPALKASAAGRIVNIGAGAAGKAAAGMGAYTASKSGVHRLTEALSEELSGTAVTVNAILPSTIDTPTNRADMPDSDFATWVQPSAIADVIVFLASAQARAISGALIPVTRGG